MFRTLLLRVLFNNVINSSIRYSDLRRCRRSRNNTIIVEPYQADPVRYSNIGKIYNENTRVYTNNDL